VTRHSLERRTRTESSSSSASIPAVEATVVAAPASDGAADRTKVAGQMQRTQSIEDDMRYMKQRNKKLRLFG